MIASSIVESLDRLDDWVGSLQDAVFLSVVEPGLQALGLATYTEDAYAALQVLCVGVLLVMVTLCMLAPLERWRPFEPPGHAALARLDRRRAVRVDIIYTLIDRLGLLRLTLFFFTGPIWNAIAGRLAVAGIGGWQLDQWVSTWLPGITDTALFGFITYAIVLDFAGYVVHRTQHRFEWWWALHAVHHSQRWLTVWSDSRNHLLDMLIVESVFVLLAHAIGVPPGQFVALVAMSKLVESLAHANADVSFGRVGERLLVGPRFHRVHHGLFVGLDGANGAVNRGCNYGVLFPVWDQMLGTARFDLAPGPTGIADQLPQFGRRDYGGGFWAQQILALRRMVQR